MSCGVFAGGATELENLHTPFPSGDNMYMFKKKNLPSYVSNDAEAMRREARHLLNRADDLSQSNVITLTTAGLLFVVGVVVMAASNGIHSSILLSAVMGWGGLLSVGLSIYLFYRIVSSGGVLDEINQVNERAIELVIRRKRLEKGCRGK